MLRHKTGKEYISKCLSLGILCLGQSVGVQEQAISRLEFKKRVGIGITNVHCGHTSSREQSLMQLKEEFIASQGSQRVLLLLSPTCPVCVEGSSVVIDVLRRHPARKIRVLAIWEPILPTDWNRPTSAVLDRLSDRRAIQWWDKQHVLATAVQNSG